MELRPYQIEAVKAAFAEFQKVDSTVLVKATGTGKTITFCEIARRFIDRFPAQKVLVLAHRTELLEQAKEKLSLFGIESAIEKAEDTAFNAFGQAVVASVQSISRPNRLKMYHPEQFSLIIIDECHHAPNETYLRVLKYFRNAKVLGVTATPNRHDEIGLKNVFKTCAYQYTIQNGIKEGYLCDVRGEQIKVKDLKLESVKIVAGEFAQNELDLMLRKEAVLQQMVLPTIERAGNRPTIVFTSGVEHAYEIAACFNRVKANSAVAVDGSLSPDKREEAINAFKNGERQFIVNVGVLTEGFDYPPVSCVALFRPTRSLGLLAQMIGRGTRTAKGKTDCLILDFVGLNNTVRTMTVMDVLDGTVLSDREHLKAQELQEDGKTATEVLKEAKAFVAALDALDAKMRALTSAKDFDVLKMFAIPNSKGLYGGDPATPRQVEFLKEKGVKCSPDLEKGEAHELISQLIERQHKGLATFKQLKRVKQLYKNEARDDIADFLTFQEASRLIAARSPKNNNYSYRRQYV